MGERTMRLDGVSLTTWMEIVYNSQHVLQSWLPGFLGRTLVGFLVTGVHVFVPELHASPCMHKVYS